MFDEIPRNTYQFKYIIKEASTICNDFFSVDTPDEEAGQELERTKAMHARVSQENSRRPFSHQANINEENFLASSI